jgi:signal peptidase I
MILVIVLSLPALALGLLIMLARRQFTLIAVTGQSMQPTLTAGDRVLVRRTCLDRLRSGQIVVVEEPGEGGTWLKPLPCGRPGSYRWMIKRVVAVPGDDRPDVCLPASLGPPEVRVPAGKLVILGDNPRRSYDSRQLGYIPGERVLGVMLRRVGPGSRVATPPG